MLSANGRICHPDVRQHIRCTPFGWNRMNMFTSSGFTLAPLQPITIYTGNTSAHTATRSYYIIKVASVIRTPTWANEQRPNVVALLWRWLYSLVRASFSFFMSELCENNIWWKYIVQNIFSMSSCECICVWKNIMQYIVSVVLHKHEHFNAIIQHTETLVHGWGVVSLSFQPGASQIKLKSWMLA